MPLALERVKYPPCSLTSEGVGDGDMTRGVSGIWYCEAIVEEVPTADASGRSSLMSAIFHQISSLAKSTSVAMYQVELEIAV